MIRAIIVEDETSGLNNLKNLLKEYCSEVEVIGEASSVEEATALFHNKRLQPDVAFLDIQLKDGLVFQALDQLNRIPFEIIFVTAFHRYAIQACSYSSIGYILKPLDPDALVHAVSRIPSTYGEKIDKRYALFTKMYQHKRPFLNKEKHSKKIYQSCMRR